MKRLLPLLLLAASSAVQAESGLYRVEVIVFRNLSTTPVITETPELRSFSRYPDPQEGVPAATAPAEPDADLLTDLPDDLRVITEKSSAMDGVWRRLRSSQTYQPLVFAAWEQNRVDYFPPIRIHDQQVIDTQFRPPTQIVEADLTAADPLAAYRSTFYQLDGSLQLRRSRFLHLFLDLEYRQQNQQNAAGAAIAETNPAAPGMGSGVDDSGAYGVYALKQNRQINTGEMQYFDTPFYGALVYVTAMP